MTIQRSNYLLYNKDRLEALADGIFAFAMTLLSINFVLPDASHIHSESALLQALVAQKSMLASYVLSFLLLGV